MNNLKITSSLALSIHFIITMPFRRVTPAALDLNSSRLVTGMVNTIFQGYHTFTPGHPVHAPRLAIFQLYNITPHLLYQHWIGIFADIFTPGRRHFDFD